MSTPTAAASPACRTGATDKPRSRLNMYGWILNRKRGRHTVQIIKSVLVTIWISAVTLAAMYGVSLWGQNAGLMAADGVSYTEFESDTLSIPVFKDGRVAGYAILRFSGAIDSDFLAAANPPIEVAHTHAAYLAFHSIAGQLEPADPKLADHALMSAHLADAMETLAQRPIARNIVVTQLDFLQRSAPQQ